MIRYALHALLCALLLGPTTAWSQESALFTAEELAWIAAHPVLRVAIDTDWAPVAYLEHGEVKGLAAEYLAAVGRISGLRFGVAPVPDWGSAREALQQGTIDLLPAVYGRFGPAQLHENIGYTMPYFAGTSLVVTRADAPVIFDARQLAGKTVAVKRGAAYERALLEMHPDVHLVRAASPTEALEQVASGEAYAAIDIDAAVLPILRQRYFDQLHVAGVLVGMPALLSMGVNSKDPVLLSIVDKSLGALSALETDQMLARWLRSTDEVQPSWSLVLQYYRLELAAALLLLLSLAVLSYRVAVAKRRAERSEKEKSMFLAVMSHEIRTPMHAILASVELLARGRLPVEEARLAKVAVSSSVTLLELLDDVLDFSKIEAKQLRLECRPVDIRALFQEAVDIAQARAADKYLPLRLVPPAQSEAWPVIDAHRVRQILNNLLSNAIKFTESGHVELRGSVEVLPASPTQATLHISVTDTGIGISARQQTRLFKAFSQADSSTTRRFGGTGLGLTICNDLIKLMQGKIRVQSELGQGTQMLIELPVALAPAPDSEPATQALPAAPSTDLMATLRVLVIEDHPINQFVIERQLAALGHQVTQALSGAAGIDLFQGSRFDLVLLDCNLPDMDGYGVAARLRESEVADGHTPIIAISAMVGTEHAAKCFEAGMDGLLGKPLRIQELNEVIELWCSGSALAGEGAATPEEVVDTSAWNPVQMFEQTTQVDLANLHEAAMGRDWQQVARLAHRITGAALTMGRHAVATASRSLEQAATQGENTEAIDRLIAELEQALATIAH